MKDVVGEGYHTVDGRNSRMRVAGSDSDASEQAANNELAVVWQGISDRRECARDGGDDAQLHSATGSVADPFTAFDLT